MLGTIVELTLSETGRICLIALLLIILFFAEVSLINILALGIHMLSIWFIYSVGVFVWCNTNLYLSLFFILASVYIYIKCSIQYVPARPAHAGLVKIMGRKTNAFCADGIKFYPLTPLFDVELINIQPVTIENETEVVLPDGTPTRLPYKLIVSPNKNRLKLYIEKGEIEGIKKILIARIEPALRVWASSEEEGPSDWREARAASADAAARIAKSLLGKCLDDIPSEIPTPCLLKYFTVPRPKPNKRDEEQFGKNWERLKDVLDKLDPKQLETLKRAVACRRKQVFDLSQAQGNFEDNSIGMIIHGWSLGRIKILGGIEEAAASKVREQEEGQGSIAEFRIDLSKAQQLMEETNKIPGGKKMSLEEAFAKITERRAIKEGQTHSYMLPGLTQALATVFEIIEKSKK